MWTSDNNQKVCREVQELLSDYLDNTLAARQVWEVEKHLAACADCARASRELQATIQVLHAAEQYDTGDAFMAKLHARLDGLDPEPTSHRPTLTVLRDWL